MLLSRKTHTGMEFWIRQTIRGLDSWIQVHNLIVKEQKEDME